MGELTEPNKLPYPLDSDVPDIPKDIKALALGVEKALKVTGVPIFADNAARDSAFSDLGISPSDGMLVWNESVQSYQRWWSGGSKWVYGWFGGFRADTSSALTANQDLTPTITQVEDWQMPNVEGFQYSGSQITLPVTGAYMVDAGGTIVVGGTAGNLRCSILRIRDGATFNVGFTDVAALAGSTNNVNRQVLFPFAAGDKISMSYRAAMGGCTLVASAIRISHVGTP